MFLGGFLSLVCPPSLAFARWAWHWFVEVGDQVPIAQFACREHLRRAVNQHRRMRKSDAKGEVVISQPLAVVRRRLGMAKRLIRCERRGRRFNNKHGPPVKSQAAIDREHLRAVREAQRIRVQQMAFDLEVQAALLDAEGAISWTAPDVDARVVEPTPIDSSPEVTSWRNPESTWYRTPRRRLLLAAVRTTLRILVLLLLIVPASSMVPASAARGVWTGVQEAAHVNYMSAEQHQEQLLRLQEIKGLPHNPRALARQFSHGINAHLPQGVATKVDPSRYVKDDECHLVMDRVPGVTEDQLNAMTAVLRRMAPSTVAYDTAQIGDGYQGGPGGEPPMQIPLNTTQRIFAPARRNWGPAELEVTDQMVKKLLSDGICNVIRDSDYACNPVIAMKRAPDGSWSDKRFCINYIPINRHTELDRYGSHRAEDLFKRVVNAKFLTALEHLRSGFHQIPMDPDSIAKTAFWYVSGENQVPVLVAYNKMPFGLKNASAKFQRVMDTELQRSGCTEFAFAYIDDLLIASNSWEEHVEHVDKVLKMLEACNLKIHPDKSLFATNIVEYLGHNVVGQHGIAMNEAKIEAIKSLPVPKSVADLRSILGFLAYYRHFIPGFSTLSSPLTEMLQKGRAWDWGPKQDASYAELRRLMTEPGRVLRPVDPKRELILHTDWSTYGIGAVLGQLDDEGKEYLCACASRSLSKHERNYPPYKGELLALSWAIRSFRHHLHGTKFRLITDHQPLVWLMKARDLNGQYARWQMLLQEYDFEIVHRAGAKHTNADVLSRFPMPHTNDYSGAQFDPDTEFRAVVAAAKSSGFTQALHDFAMSHPGVRLRWNAELGVPSIVYDAGSKRTVATAARRPKTDPKRARPAPCACPVDDDERHPAPSHHKYLGHDGAKLIPHYTWDREAMPAGTSQAGCVNNCLHCCHKCVSRPVDGSPVRASVRRQYCLGVCRDSCGIPSPSSAPIMPVAPIERPDDQPECSTHGKACPGRLKGRNDGSTKYGPLRTFAWQSEVLPRGTSADACCDTCKRCCEEVNRAAGTLMHHAKFAKDHCQSACIRQCASLPGGANHNPRCAVARHPKDISRSAAGDSRDDVSSPCERPLHCTVHGADCPGQVCHPAPEHLDVAGPGFRWDRSRMPAGSSTPHCVYMCEGCCQEALKHTTSGQAGDLPEWCQNTCRYRCTSGNYTIPYLYAGVAKAPTTSIDCFAPKFSSMLKGTGVVHVDESHYMEAAMREPDHRHHSPSGGEDDADSPLDEYVQEARVAVAKALHDSLPPRDRPLVNAVEVATTIAAGIPRREPSKRSGRQQAPLHQNRCCWSDVLPDC